MALGQSANECYEKGNLLYTLRRYDLAEKEFRKGLVFDPLHFNCLYALCSVSINKNALAEAESFADQLIENYPYHFQSHYQKSKVLYYLKKYNESIEAVNTALRYEPVSEACILLLAKCYVQKNEKRKALETVKRGIEISPEFADAHLFLLELITYAFRNKKEEAEKTISILLKLRPDTAIVHRVVGKYRSLNNQTLEALKHYSIALKSDPSDSITQREYKALYNDYRSGLKGPHTMFGVEIGFIDSFVFISLIVLGFFLLFFCLKIFGLEGVKIEGINWLYFSSSMFFSLFILPFSLIYCYLKFIKKNKVNSNPFYLPVDVDNQKYKLTLKQFFTINHFYNTKMVLLWMGIFFLLVSLLILLTSKDIISKDQFAAITSMIVSTAIPWIRFFKFREE